MTGGSINNNLTDGYGGGVYLTEPDTLNMSGGKIEENTGPSNRGGGAVYNNNGAVLIYQNASIPAPENLVGKNDVYLYRDPSATSKYSGLIATSASVAPASGIYATITPSSYTAGLPLVIQDFPDNPLFSTPDFYKFFKVIIIYSYI